MQVRIDTTGHVVLAVEGTATLSLRGFTRHLLSRLGPAMPNEVLPLERLPQLPNGKVDRRALVAMIEGAAGDTETPDRPVAPGGTAHPTGRA